MAFKKIFTYALSFVLLSLTTLILTSHEVHAATAKACESETSGNLDYAENLYIKTEWVNTGSTGAYINDVNSAKANNASVMNANITNLYYYSYNASDTGFVKNTGIFKDINGATYPQYQNTGSITNFTQTYSQTPNGTGCSFGGLVFNSSDLEFDYTTNIFLLCGHAANTPATFKISMSGNPDKNLFPANRYKTGTWSVTEYPKSHYSRSNPPPSNSSFTFNYNTIDGGGHHYSNGSSHTLYAYYTPAPIKPTVPPTITCDNSINTIPYSNAESILYTTTNLVSGTSYTVDAIIGPRNITSSIGSSININPPLGIGTYTVKLSLMQGSTNISTANCSLRVIIQPYFKSYGAGISVGGGFMSQGSCSQDSLAQIGAFNNSIRTGSSTDQEAFSFANVIGLGSANNSGSPPDLLTFGNDVNSGPWGGNFGSGYCIPDYYNTIKKLGATTVSTLPASVNGRDVYVYTNPLPNRDLVLTNNILFSNPNSQVTDPTTLPYLYILAYGQNIVIDNSVTELDATLIAEPDANGNGGNIYTCQDEITTAAIHFNNCSNQLVVKGALIGESVNLLRAKSNSSVTSPGNNSNLEGNCPSNGLESEIICYSPLYWITNPFIQNGGTSELFNGMDFINNLPPTL